jgi:hypothetical protein
MVGGLKGLLTYGESTVLDLYLFISPVSIFRAAYFAIAVVMMAMCVVLLVVVGCGGIGGGGCRCFGSQLGPVCLSYTLYVLDKALLSSLRNSRHNGGQSMWLAGGSLLQNF